MRISIVQPDTLWEDKTGNFRELEKLIKSLDNTDIVILPEMFNTGFSIDPVRLSEPPKSITFDWLISISEKGNLAVCGSYIVKGKEKFFNRWVFVTPEKKSWHYDKRHLFRISGEQKVFSPGTKRVFIKYRGLRIAPNVCYDLRFPVWSRNRNEYDLLINSANWPWARRDVWVTLLKARSIENQCFTAGSNRTGVDGAGIKYCGDSMIINPRGEIIASAGRKKNCTISTDISLEELSAFRKKFPVLKDADKFIITA
jgi:omega-amidase